MPTRDEIELASKSLGVVYLPPDAGELSKAPGPPPAPKVKIDNKTLNKVAPPRPEQHQVMREDAEPGASAFGFTGGADAAAECATRKSVAAHRDHSAAAKIDFAAGGAAADDFAFESWIARRFAGEGAESADAGRDRQGRARGLQFVRQHSGRRRAERRARARWSSGRERGDDSDADGGRRLQQLHQPVDREGETELVRGDAGIGVSRGQGDCFDYVSDQSRWKLSRRPFESGTDFGERSARYGGAFVDSDVESV